MKRHFALAHLSREHHGALVLARLLQEDAPGYKGLPTDTNGKVTYALNFYHSELIKHFKEEEEVLNLVIGINAKLDSLVETIFSEHKDLHILFRALNNPLIENLYIDKLGKKLEAHIRKEERELFPLIQENCSDEMMAEIDKSLTSHL